MTDNDNAFQGINLDEMPHERGDIDLLMKIYRNRRINWQSGFYEGRIRENQRNSDFTFNLATFIMTLSSFLATISASVTGQQSWLVNLFPIFSAVLPAFAALLAAFRQLYGWDRQILIYRDSLLGLERARLLVPDDDRLNRADIVQIFPKLVSASENVFSGEAAQWGQFVLAKPEEEIEDDLPFDQLLARVGLSEEQMAAIQAVMGAGRGSGDLTISAETKVLTAGESVYSAPAGDGMVIEGISQTVVQQTTNTEVTVHSATQATEGEATAALETGMEEAGETVTETESESAAGTDYVPPDVDPEATSAG